MEKVCPFCGERIPVDALTCLYCGEKQPENHGAPDARVDVESVSNMKPCPICGELINSEVKMCPFCKEPLVKTESNPSPSVSLDSDAVSSGQDRSVVVSNFRKKRRVGLIACLSVAGILVLTSICFFVFYGGDYQKRAEKFIMNEKGLSEFNTLIQCEGHCPSVYYCDNDGFPVKYDLKWRKKTQLRSFKCINNAQDVHYIPDPHATFRERPKVFYYRDRIVICGYCEDADNKLRMDAVVYDTYSCKTRYICSGGYVKLCLPFVISGTGLNDFEYYDVETGNKVEMTRFSGTRGDRRLNVELAVADNGQVVGHLNYVDEGPYVRSPIVGNCRNGKMFLEVSIALHEKSDVVETMTLNCLEDGNMTGIWNSKRVEWEQPLRLYKK